jgi:hypothetical protein
MRAELAGVALRERPPQLGLERVDTPANAGSGGSSVQPKPSPSARTPRRRGSPSWRVKRSTGSASATSLAMMTPRNSRGSVSSHGHPRGASRACWRSRSSGLGSSMFHAERRPRPAPPRPCAGAAAELQHLAAADRGQHLERLARDAAAEQRGDSGAVTKSPAAPSLAAPPL